jgi:hypothetical protein
VCVCTGVTSGRIAQHIDGSLSWASRLEKFASRIMSASSPPRVHISRQGSVDVIIGGGDGDGSEPNGPALAAGDFAEQTFAGSQTFRERAKNAIKMTLSPGSEFSFESRDRKPRPELEAGSTTVDVETSVSLGKLESILHGGRRTGAKDEMRLQRIEADLAETRARLLHNEERIDEKVASPLQALRAELGNIGTRANTKTLDPFRAPEDQKVRDDLNATLRRLEAVSNREGAMRMENYSLRTTDEATEKLSGDYFLRPNADRNNTKPPGQNAATSKGTAADDPVSRNLILRCAVLEEKLEASEAKRRRAETTVQALVEQLKRMRSTRTQDALNKEQDLYSRIEANMANVFDLSGPLLQTESNAQARHAEIAANLSHLDAVVQRQVANLRAQVKRLEGDNSRLTAELELRPQYKDFKYLVHRENALHGLIERNKILDDDGGPLDRNLLSSPVVTQNGITKDRSLHGVDDEHIRSAQERVSRFIKGERGGGKNERDTLFSGPIRPPLNELSVLWASASVLRDVMNMLDVEKALDVYDRIKTLGEASRLQTAMKTFVEDATGQIEAAAKVHAGRVYQPGKEQESAVVESKQLGGTVMSLDECLIALQSQLRERRAMAFAQTAPQLLVHKILVQFQMLLNVDAGDEVVSALHNLVAKLRHSKMLLQKIRGLFGLPKNVDDDEDLVSVVELYVRNLGLAQTERW